MLLQQTSYYVYVQYYLKYIAFKLSVFFSTPVYCISDYCLQYN